MIHSPQLFICIIYWILVWQSSREVEYNIWTGDPLSGELSATSCLTMNTKLYIEVMAIIMKLHSPPYTVNLPPIVMFWLFLLCVCRSHNKNYVPTIIKSTVETHRSPTTGFKQQPFYNLRKHIYSDRVFVLWIVLYFEVWTINRYTAYPPPKAMWWVEECYEYTDRQTDKCATVFSAFNHREAKLLNRSVIPLRTLLINYDFIRQPIHDWSPPKDQSIKLNSSNTV